ncbi:hypothetical protein, partial [Kineococcus sp. SYSU DK018]|uniref:hypothetical protein n=1 Tax=Kineococcus sp. SYSU DK018 TaxID=3383139 RepID=UPI003D7E36D3
MSTERRHELHADLLAALAGDAGAARSLRERPPAPADEPQAQPPALPGLPSPHRRALAVALTGAPLLVDDPTGGGTFTAALLAALAADGRRALHLTDRATSTAVRADLAREGLEGLLEGEDSPTGGTQPGGAQAGGAQPVDETRREQLRALLDRYAGTLHARPADGGPTAFEVFAELVELRTAHVHPPLLPAAATWDQQRRTEVAELLHGSTAPVPDGDPGAVDSPEEADRLLAELDPLPAALADLPGLTDRLRSEVSWQPLRTLGDAERAVDLLGRVEAAERTYLPLALTADLDQARAVLTQQQRSFLSAEERTRRREVKRLAALRHDGTFGLRDVEELRALRGSWAEHASGPPRAWRGRAQLAQQLDTVRRLLDANPAALSPLPQDTAEVELAQLSDLAARAEQARAALLHRRRQLRLSAEGLQDLAAAVPAGAGEEEVSRLVRAAWLRALADVALDALDAVAGRPGGLAAEFRALDERASRTTAQRLRAALAAHGPAPRCLVAHGPAEVPGDAEFDVLVVGGAHRRPAEDVLALAGRARQLVVVGTAEGTGLADGSAWSALAALLPAHELRWPEVPEHAPTTAVRDAVAGALRAADLSVTAGELVAGHPVDLLVAPPAGGAPLAVELDGAAYLALPTVGDRHVARPGQLERSGLSVHRVWSAAWFRDPGREVQRVVESLRRIGEEAERAAREEAERAAREEAERAAREEAERAAREEAERAAREEAERAARE